MCENKLDLAFYYGLTYPLKVIYNKCSVIEFLLTICHVDLIVYSRNTICTTKSPLIFPHVQPPTYCPLTEYYNIKNVNKISHHP